METNIHQLHTRHHCQVYERVQMCARKEMVQYLEVGSPIFHCGLVHIWDSETKGQALQLVLREQNVGIYGNQMSDEWEEVLYRTPILALLPSGKQEPIGARL